MASRQPGQLICNLVTTKNSGQLYYVFVYIQLVLFTYYYLGLMLGNDWMDAKLANWKASKVWLLYILSLPIQMAEGGLQWERAMRIAREAYGITDKHSADSGDV